MNAKSIAGIIVAVLGLINLIITSCGVSPIPVDAEGIGIAVSTVFTLAGAATTTWYNFSVTTPAKVADEIGSRIKSGELTVKQVLDAIDAITQTDNKEAWEADVSEYRGDHAR